MNKIHRRILISLLFSFLLIARQAGAQEQFLRLEPDTTRINNIMIRYIEGEWQIETTGNDPWILTGPLSVNLPSDATVLAFEYFCPAGLDHMQIFFSPGFDEKDSKTVNKVGLSEGWTGYSIDLKDNIKSWGKRGDRLRIDLGSRSGVKILIRNPVIRTMTRRETELAMNYEEKKRREAEMEKNLRKYLGSDYSSEINDLFVDSLHLTIKGRSDSNVTAYLCEVPPWVDVTEADSFDFSKEIKQGMFEVVLDRFQEKNGIMYDRLLSKWVIACKTDEGISLLSHSRYPDNIRSKYNLPAEPLSGRKGLGGFSTNRGHIQDLDELGITSATVNIWFTRFMFTKPAPGRISYPYNGKVYYFGERDVTVLDSTFRTTARKGIVTAAILLVGKAEQCPDPEIGKLLQHPDMDPAGIYSMPNMTTPESTDCYAAALDFLAGRYSRPDKKYGRINHWIIHNEVDAGWVWTNMGKKSALLYMDTYIKSMRLCYAIARSYNPESEVFISLTHHWAWTSNPLFHPSKELLDILLEYTEREGDFKWALAHHPYPQSLYEPKTWLDEQVDYTFNTPLITFKNLEVIDAWIKQPEVLYRSRIKRTLWLSENGTNSKSYAEQDLLEQAAGFAYAWKKMKNLDGIDGFQWHNWFDHRGEGGLRIGLRKFPDDKDDPGGPKPVWYLYKAADTKSEDAVFEPYKKTIGIKTWKEIEYHDDIFR